MASISVDSAEAIASKEMCFACFDALLAHFNGQTLRHPAYSNHLCPLFVSWETILENGASRLRGCIGSLASRYLHGGLGEYALHSGVGDKRFHPLQLHDVPSLECKVSLLKCYELAEDHLDWEVGIHGRGLHSSTFQLNLSCF